MALQVPEQLLFAVIKQGPRDKAAPEKYAA